MKKCLKFLGALILAVATLPVIACNNKATSNPINPSHDDSSYYSSSNSDSGSSSSNNNDGRYSFKDIASLLADVSNANAMGIRANNNLKPSGLYKKEKSGTKVKNLWVKSTTVYDSNEPEMNEDGTVNVTFSKTVTTEREDEVTVTKTIIIKPSKYKINTLLEDENGVVVETQENREFKVMHGNDVLLDWTAGVEEIVTLENEDEGQEPVDGNPEENPEPKTATGVRLTFAKPDNNGYQIETRLTNAIYSFPSLEGDKYSLQVKGSETKLFNEVLDNQEGDSNPDTGMIAFTGLTEGVDYTFTQVGIRYSETIEQEDVDGVVDKLYTMGQYTFVSFVLPEASNRPDNSQLTFNEFGISDYDAKDYYSDNTRQSFVINNESGLVYKIQNFRISKIENNLIYSSDSSFIYDFKINDKNELVFFTLFTNSAIKPLYAFKDRYDHIFIQNDKVESYDADKDATYYITPKGTSTFEQYINYFLTYNKETLKITFANGETPISQGIIQNDKTVRPLTEDDAFYVCKKSDYRDDRYFGTLPLPYCVENGLIKFRNTRVLSSGFIDGALTYIKYDFIKGEKTTVNINLCCKDAFIDQYDIILVFGEPNIYAFYNILSILFKKAAQAEDRSILCNYGIFQEILHDPEAEAELLVADCTLSTKKETNDTVIKYGLDANYTYVFHVVDVNGRPTAKAFEEGTYFEEVAVVLQPIG